jgi:hypothetical protein
MSVYTYGITYEDLIYGIPGVDAAQIGPHTQPVSTQNLVLWAEDAASLLNGALAKSGIVANASLEATAHARCKAAVKDYVVVQVMITLAIDGPLYEQARTKWNQAYSELSNRPQQLGTAYADTTRSNIDTQTATYGTNTWSFQGVTGRSNW